MHEGCLLLNAGHAPGAIEQVVDGQGGSHRVAGHQLIP
jgi:hypothetical protein